MSHSREYLEEVLRLAKKQLPGWAFAVLQQMARAQAGARARHNPTDAPGYLEKLALTEVRPENLAQLEGADLKRVWLRLEQWFANFRRKKQPTENVINAALWVKAEMERRGFKVEESKLTRAVAVLEQTKAQRSGIAGGCPEEIPKQLAERLKEAPDEVMIVRDFAVLGGSGAVCERPNDLDVIIRADYIIEKDRFLLDGSMLGAALRRFLSPDKKSQQVQLTHSAQGGHTDYVPLYDLVARRRAPEVVRVEPEPAKYTGQDRVVKAGVKVGTFFRMPTANNRTLRTTDELIEFYQQHPELFPLFARQRYGGAPYQIHKDGGSIAIYSSSGEDRTGRLPSIVDAVANIELDPLVLVASVNRWSDGQPVQQDLTDSYLAGDGDISDTGITANITDVLWHGPEGDVSNLRTWEREGRLKRLDLASDEGAPSSALNLAPVWTAESADEIGQLTNRVTKISGSTGVTLQQVDKPYNVGGETIPGSTSYPWRQTVAKAMAFVSSSPSLVDLVTGRPFAGPEGNILDRLYLAPLGLTRNDVSLTTDATLPNPCPATVIALGSVAKTKLGDAAHFTLPHPYAVRKHGDSGEVGRKIRQIRRHLEKQAPATEGGTRSSAAVANWDKRWQDLPPKSGTGRFVYQHHWRGLRDDELAKTDAQLMGEPGRSIHGDIRLESDDGLWGWSVFLGKSQDNRDRGPQHDKLIDWRKGDKIECSPKLGQPKEWLDVGRGKPLITEPGGPGATSGKSAKFFAIDHGTYKLGVVRNHFAEIFLDGKRLKGRYLFQLAPVAGRRRWLIDKPADQTPIAEARDLADVISELKKKKQKFLIWAKPGERPKKIDVRTGKVAKSMTAQIVKSDPCKRIVYGVVLDPYGADGAEADAHLDWPTPACVEGCAHDFMLGDRQIRLQHGKPAKAQVVESSIEQYPSMTDYRAAMNGLPHRVTRRHFGSDVIHSGSWLLGVMLAPDEWADFLAGKYNAFSPAGSGLRTPIDAGDLPNVTFIDLVEQT